MPLVIAAAPSSRTGELLVQTAHRRGISVRTLHALDDRSVVSDAIRDAGAIVLVPARGDAERHAHAAIEALTEAAQRFAPMAHVLLVTSFAVGHGAAHPLTRVTASLPGMLAAERTLRASGLAWTIVRPTWLTDDPSGAHAVRATQDPSADGMISRADLAVTLLAATEHPLARGRTFALFNEPGEPPRDWASMFAELAPDREPASR